MRVDAGENLSALIGRRFVNAQGQVVGILEDIRFDRDGVAQDVVVQDGGFFGYPDDLVVLPYASLFTASVDNDSVRPVTSALKKIARAAPPADNMMLSATMLLHASLYAPGNRRMADIEDFTMRNARLDKVLLAFAAAPNMGKTVVAIPFDVLTVATRDGHGVNFELNVSQAEALTNYQAKKVPLP